MWGRAACGPTGVSGAGGPGRCVCRWAAARPRAVRAVCCCLWLRWCSGRRRARPPARSPHASLRLGVVDLEARPCPPVPPAPSTPAAPGALTCGLARRLEARPGPATAHRHRGRSLRRPSHLWGLIADRRVASKPGQAPPPPTGTAARPSYPSGALHTSGAWSLMLLGALGCCLARSCCLLWASWGSRVLSFWGALVRVVTNVVNSRCFSCGFLPRCYERRQSEGFFADNGGFWA